MVEEIRQLSIEITEQLVTLLQMYSDTTLPVKYGTVGRDEIGAQIRASRELLSQVRSMLSITKQANTEVLSEYEG